MKKICVILISLLSFTSFSQDYETMSIEVQQKMNENKLAGQPILQDVYAHYQIELGNLPANQHQAMIATFANSPQVRNTILTPDGTTLKITANATFSIKEIKNLIVSTDAYIENYTVNYSITE